MAAYLRNTRYKCTIYDKPSKNIKFGLRLKLELLLVFIINTLSSYFFNFKYFELTQLKNNADKQILVSSYPMQKPQLQLYTAYPKNTGLPRYKSIEMSKL